MIILRRNADYASALEKLGIEALHPWQEDVLKSVLDEGRDALFVVPTGGGKSLIYQLPAVMEVGHYLTVVVSPMLSLQRDQVNKLTDRGIPAVLLNSELSDSARTQVLNSLSAQALLYLAPEQLQRDDLRDALRKCDVVRVAVDEAHLIPEQPSFRAAFTKLGEFIHSLSAKPQIIACSATVTEKERHTIQKTLGMNDPFVQTLPIYRANLRLSVKRAKNDEVRRGMLLDELQCWNKKGLALVFSPTVDEVQKNVTFLCKSGIEALPYYADLPKKTKQNNSEAFASGDCKVLVATTAFSLGVDIPNIRLVIHAGLPLGLTEYVQQIGRGGRNGRETRCLLLYTDSDMNRNRGILQAHDKQEYYERMENLGSLIAAIKSDDCLWKSISAYYGQVQGDCGHCDHCRRR